MSQITLDVETTGLDTKAARVIELAIVVASKTQGPFAGHAQMGHYREWRCNPGMPIPPSSTEVHGFTDNDVADAPGFLYHAPEIALELKNATVIIGYNLDFDLQVLRAEFARTQIVWPVRPDVHLIDVMRLWRKLEPRSLRDAHKRFMGSDYDGAHRALNDVIATNAVLPAMLGSFNPSALFGENGEQPRNALSWAEIAAFINPDAALRFGASDHLKWQGLPGSGPDADLVLMTFGKYSGKPLTIVAGIDANYLRWVARGGFPPHVVEACSRALALAPAAFTRWAREYGGR